MSDKPLVISGGRLSAGHFPNLARHLENDDSPTDNDKKIIDEVTTQVESELHLASIKVFKFRSLFRLGEVPSHAVGTLSTWTFKRAWYYYVAEGPGLPVEVAEQLHEKHGNAVRVAGHCGCPSPREWYKGFGVGLYHVDTQEGLNALAVALRSVYVEDAEELEK